MQLPIPWRTGQAKPFGSRPRLNWSHPLAWGLASYVYDCGDGTFIDLVGGRTGTRLKVGTPVAATVGSSKYGNAWKFNGQTAQTATDCFYFSATATTANPRLAKINATGSQVSFGAGFMPTSVSPSTAQLATVMGVADGNGNNNYVDLVFGAGPPMIPLYGIAQTSEQGFTSAPTVKAFAFTTMVATGTVAATGSLNCYYFDSTGVVKSQNITGFTGIINASSTANHSIADFDTSSGTAHQAGFIGNIYWSGVWIGRILSASEARLLHDDPYCLLVYPEDEIFASLVGAAAAPPALPAAPAERIPWILPGLGPASRHVSLLNAGLPAQPVVQPVAGGTLPFMGVGG